jgi:hypothetical protein
MCTRRSGTGSIGTGLRMQTFLVCATNLAILPVLCRHPNLRKSGYSAGGSSSGRGAQVAAGEVDWRSAAISAARSVCRRRLILCCRIWPLGHRHRTTACAIHRNQPPPRGIRGNLIPCRHHAEMARGATEPPEARCFKGDLASRVAGRVALEISGPESGADPAARKRATSTWISVVACADGTRCVRQDATCSAITSSMPMTFSAVRTRFTRSKPVMNRQVVWQLGQVRIPTMPSTELEESASSNMMPSTVLR